VSYAAYDTYARAVDAVGVAKDSDVRLCLDQAGADCDSPIEKTLLAALVAVGVGDGWPVFVGLAGDDGVARYLQFPRLEICGADTVGLFETDAARERGAISIRPQYDILKYTADFLLSWVAPPLADGARRWVGIVLECDGHDFHAQTKGQAAHDRSRDRAMQELGWDVFRFTGAELWKDPIACARQALTHLVRKADELCLQLNVEPASNGVCPHCSGPHSAAAHFDLSAALAVTKSYADAGDDLMASVWSGVVQKLAHVAKRPVSLKETLEADW